MSNIQHVSLVGNLSQIMSQKVPTFSFLRAEKLTARKNDTLYKYNITLVTLYILCTPYIDIIKDTLYGIHYVVHTN